MPDLTAIEILSHLTVLRAQVSGLCLALQTSRIVPAAQSARSAGDGEVVPVRLNSAILRRVEDWQARQSDLPNRAIALERMIEAFLDLDAWARRPGLSGAGTGSAGAGA